MTYLSYALYPIVIGYAIYALKYETHKSWYSWILNSLVGAVYTFGFILMCPQVRLLDTVTESRAFTGSVRSLNDPILLARERPGSLCYYCNNSLTCRSSTSQATITIWMRVQLRHVHNHCTYP